MTYDEWLKESQRLRAELERRENATEDLLDRYEYYTVGHDRSCLDGNFSASELRAIADAMDALKDTPEYRAYIAHRALKPAKP